MKPIKLNSPRKRRALLLAAVPLTAVLAGGVAVAATSGSTSPTAPAGCTLQDRDQIRDRARDGSCLDSPAATPSATASMLQDQVRERARDGSCLNSPTTVPGATLQHMYEHRYQHGDEVTDR